MIRRALAPMRGLAARAYVAGPTLADGVRVARALERRGHATALGPWDGPGDSPQETAATCLAAVGALGGSPRESYLSIKLPALGYDRSLLRCVVAAAHRAGRTIHFDALAPETVPRSWTVLEEELAGHALVGCTLPGRWVRSVDDARRAVDLGWRVRVVKGHWADAREPRRDMRQGFLAVVEALAGRARHVSVATHDVPLARRAIARLRAAGTPCDLELLFGLPWRASLAAARAAGVAVRIYVPYGTAYLPYGLSHGQGRSRLAWWLVRDAIRGGLRRASSTRAQRRVHRLQ